MESAVMNLFATPLYRSQLGRAFSEAELESCRAIWTILFVRSQITLLRIRMYWLVRRCPVFVLYYSLFR